MKRVLAAAGLFAREAAGIAGAASVTYGFWLAWPPLGFIVGGGIVLAAVIILAGRDND